MSTTSGDPEKSATGSYLIQELLDDADLTSTWTQLLQQLHVLHLESGEPIREKLSFLAQQEVGQQQSSFTQVSLDQTFRTSYRRFGRQVWFGRFHHT